MCTHQSNQWSDTPAHDLPNKRRSATDHAFDIIEESIVTCDRKQLLMITRMLLTCFLYIIIACVKARSLETAPKCSNVCFALFFLRWIWYKNKTNTLSRFFGPISSERAFRLKTEHVCTWKLDYSAMIFIKDSLFKMNSC